MDDATPLHTALRHFPLTGRPKPACGPLPDRIADVTTLATAAGKPGADVLRLASDALNKAALIASDCGLPDLARDLCWRHINAYRDAPAPLTIQQARGMLGPALNLARLHLRANKPDEALGLLDRIYQALFNSTDLTIDGRRLPLATLTGTPKELRQLREDTWLQYLSDGVRAHAMRGQWDQAKRHALRNRGIGDHLMDGRQAAIIARCLADDQPGALEMLAETVVTQPWEQQVTGCLAVMCTGDDDAITTMTKNFLASDPAPGYAAYRARLGVTVITLAHPTDRASLVNTVATEAITSGDTYAARDVLTHPVACEYLSRGQHHDLTDSVSAAGLGAGAIPPQLHNALITAASTADSGLRVSLASKPRQPVTSEYSTPVGTTWAVCSISKQIVLITHLRQIFRGAIPERLRLTENSVIPSAVGRLEDKFRLAWGLICIVLCEDG